MSWKSVLAKWLGISRYNKNMELIKLNLLVDTAPIPICTIDSKGVFITTNKAYEEMLGYTKEELRGLTCYDVTHPHYRSQNMNSSIAFESGYVKDKVYIKKDGTPIDVTVRTAFVHCGKDLTFCTAFVLDTTEQHRTLDRLTASEASLRSALRELTVKTHQLEESHRMAKLGYWTHGSPADSWTESPEPNVLYWSREVYDIFEVDHEYKGDLWEKFIGAIHPEDVEAVSFAYTTALEEKRQYSVRHRLLMRDGRVKDVIEWCETTYADDGAPLKSFGTVQDVSSNPQMCGKPDCPNRRSYDNG